MMASEPWAQTALDPRLHRLRPREVELFRLALCAPADLIAARRNLLDETETARADRRRIEAKRTEFILTRAALRRVLAMYLQCLPEAVHFDIAEHGKPALSPRHGSTLSFNVSHSHNVALIAVADGLALGVDVEQERVEVDYPRIAQRFFSPNETRVLEALDPSEQQSAFFRCWSRKEAVIKGNGRGIALGLAKFDVSLGPADAPALLATRYAPEEAAKWRLVDVSPGHGYAGALAVRAPEVTVRTFALSP